MGQDMVNAGVVTEIAGLVRDGVHGGGLHIYKDAVEGKVLVKIPGVNEFKEFDVVRKRTLMVESIEGVVDAVRIAKERYGGNPVVFVSVDGIIVSFNEAEGSLYKQHAIYKHKWAPQWAAVLKLLQGPTLPIDALRKFLRVDMRNAATASSEAFASAIAAVHGTTTTSVGSTREGQRETLGRDVASEVRGGAGEIPTSFMLEVRVSLDILLTAKHDIPIDVDVSPRNLDTQLVADAAAVEVALADTLEKAQDLIRGRLEQSQLTGVDVLIGKIGNVDYDKLG